MAKIGDNIFKIILLITGIIVIAFNVLLYNFCEKQKDGINKIIDQQKVDAQVENNKFKYQQDRIEHLSQDLQDAQDQIKDQKDALAQEKDALLQEVEKRQQVEDESKSIQTSLVDVKAEADAIKQDMKGWQKDYVSVLADLEKGIDTIQGQIKDLHANLNSLDIPGLNQKINSLQTEVESLIPPPSTSSLPGAAAPAVESKSDSTSVQSQ